MENIKIIDNFLDMNELNQCTNIVNNKSWYMGHASSGGIEKFNEQFFASYDLDIFFTHYIKVKLETTFSKKFKLDRNYMHIQLYSQNGSYHVDAYQENTYTFCMYLTDIPDACIENADGDFLLKIPNTNYIICINTMKNRGILFPSNYLHKGMAYNRMHCEKRTCITWKLTEIL
jgi:hypothetical protein